MAKKLELFSFNSWSLKMSMTRSRSSWLAILALLLLSSTSYAGVVGTHLAKGVVNVTFSMPTQKTVKTVSTSDETWNFNADKTFSRGGVLTGRWKWKRERGSVVVEANYSRRPYITHLSNFWANLGVNVSNVRILKSKVLIQAVSNGLSIEETLDYSMDVAENGGTEKAMVSIRGSFVAPDGASDNPALREMFPNMVQGQAAASASSVNGSVTYNASSFAMTASSATVTFQAPGDYTGSSNVVTQPDPLLTQPDSTQTPQQ